MMGEKILISLILLFSLLSTVCATHFRFGTISWRIPDVSQPTTVEFYSSFTFRRSFFGKPNIGSTINPGTFSFGDGSSNEQIYLLITSLSLEADWVSGTFSTTHAYPAGVTKNYTAGHTAAGRIVELNNNPNQNWNVTCTISILAYVTNANGVRVLNTAPVSNNLPIVSAYSNEVNIFKITAQDPEGTPLTYSPATPLDMGGKNHVLVPNLTVNSTGWVTFNTVGVKDGYWCTQIKFSDGLSYAVVDFLIFIAPRPKVCSANCGNKGVTCTVDTNCTSCTTTSRCIPALPPYIVYPPTPLDGASFSVEVNKTITYSWSAFTPNAGTVSVTSSSLPPSSTLTTTATGNPFNQTLTWTPTLAEVGVYVVTLGCLDSTGQSCVGQSSFSINVERPFCGYGTISPSNCDPASKTCTCNCLPGYNPDAQCYDCLPGYYGPKCLQCPPCVNGVCDTGISGVGGCTCNVGWQGSNCSFPLNKPCSPTAGNYIVSNVSTGQFVNPSTVYAYFSNASSATALTVRITSAIPAAPVKLDVLLLIDVTKSITTSMLSFLQENYARTFFGNVRALVTNSYFGVATFTDEPADTGCSASDYPFRLHLPLSTDQTEFTTALSTYMKTTSLGCDDTVSKNDAQLDALVQSASAGIGWRSDAYKVVIVITDSTFWEGSSTNTVYNTRADVLASLVGNNIQPIILCPSGVLSVYTSLINSLGFGLAVSINSDYSTALSTAYNQIVAILKVSAVVVAQDTYGFVTGGLGRTSITPPTSRVNAVTMRYPAVNLDTVANYPEIVVTSMGWGSSTIVAQVNRAPIASVCSVTTREDINVEVPISGSDSDGNGLIVFMTALPSRGYLTINKSTTARVALSSYSIPDGSPSPFFYYVPNLRFYGTDSFQYYLSDGCSRTAVISCSITVTFYDYPPVATSTVSNTTENQQAVFVMDGSDVETPTSGLVFTITSLPDPTLGVLRRVSTNNLVVINERLNPGENSVLFVPVTYACCDIATFNFVVRDSAGQTSTPGTLGISIIGVNQVPTPSAANVTVERGVRTPIIFNAWDPDRGDSETFTVTRFTGSSTGTFTTANGTPFPAAPFNVSTVIVDANGNAATTIYYTSPNNQVGANFASVTFTVMDLASVSTPYTVFASINTVNRLPSANPAGPITLFQDGISANWNLNGTDADPADANSLRAQIVSPPSKGTLAEVNGNDITTGFPFALSYPWVNYRTTQTGEDSFTFRVVDLLGATSTLQNVRILITPVNHAPTATFPQATTAEDTQVTLYVSPYDQDGDPLTVVITSLSRGTMTQFNGAPINTFPANITDSQFRFKFQGLQDEFGSPYASFTFYVDDNQGKPNSFSAIVTGYITVTPVNDPPVPLPFTLTIKENDPPTWFVLPAYDVENSSAVSGFLISKPLASLGVLKNISNQILDVRTLIDPPRNVSFTPNAYQYGTATFSFGANDGLVDSDVSATVTIVVQHVNHAPSATATSPVTASRAVPLTVTIVVRDFDIGDNITVIITGFGRAGTLAYGSTPIPSAPFVLPGTFNIPAYNSRSITLTYTAPATATPGAAFDNFTFIAQDQGGLNSSATFVSLSIANNNAPVANPAGPLQVVQDFNSSTLALSGTDADAADANNLTVVIVTPPSKGRLYQSPSGAAISSANTALPNGVSSVLYSTTQRGTDSFTFAVRDLLGALSAPVTVTIPITNTNHAPSAFWVGTAIAAEDTLFLVITNIQASDPDGDVVNVTISSGPDSTKGFFTQMTGESCPIPCTIKDPQFRIRFTPAPDSNAPVGVPFANISFYAFDTSGTRSSTVMGSLFITPVNDAPVANNSVVITYENNSTSFVVKGYDIDTPMSSVTIVIQSIPNINIGSLYSLTGTLLQVGSVVCCNQTLQFIPVRWANGNTNFSFSLFDGALTSNVASVSIVVTPVHQIPIPSVSPASNISVGRPSSTDVQLTAFDPDKDETYSFNLVSYSTDGPDSLMINAGNVIITSATTVILANVVTVNNYATVDLTYNVGNNNPATYLFLTFTVSDNTSTSDPFTLKLYPSPNNPPTVTPVANQTTDEEVLSGIITLTGTDADGDALKVLITDLPVNGVLYDNTTKLPILTKGQKIAGNTVSYLGKDLFYGEDFFTFAVQDPVQATSPKSRVNIKVAHVNHKPTITAGGRVTTPEDARVLITQVFASDVDGDRVKVYIKNQPAAGNGFFSQADGTNITAFPAEITSTSFDFYFTPDSNKFGFPYLTYVLYAEDNGWPSIARSDEITAYIDVTPVDDPPIATPMDLVQLEVPPATAFNLTLNFTDVDTGDVNITAYILSLPSSSIGTLTLVNGSLLAVGDAVPYPRVVTFSPLTYTFGNTSFSFNVKDETSFSASPATVALSITHVNHDPTGSSSSATAVRGVPLVITLAGFDHDAGDTFSFVIDTISGGSGGVFTSSTGTPLTTSTPIATNVPNTASRTFSTTLNYTAPINAVGTRFATITYHIVDQSGGVSATYTLSVDIASNSAPIATPAFFNATQDTPSTPVPITGTDADPADANTLLLNITTLPTQGVLIVNSTFNITTPGTVLPAGTPISYYTTNRGADSFSYYVQDNIGTRSGTANAEITIIPVNHPPTAIFHGPASGIEDNNVTINQISFSDPDGDTVSIYVTAIPPASKGTLTQYDGTPITSVATPVLVTDPRGWLVFVPAPDQNGDPIASFSFYASDGLGGVTSTISGAISVAAVNDPPVALSDVTTADENAPAISITPKVSDVDTDLVNVSVYLASLPDRAIGTIVNATTLQPIDLLAKIPDPRQVLFQLVPFAHGNTSFTFYATDGIDDSLTFGTQTIAIASVNQVPRAAAASPVNAHREVATPITLEVVDEDTPEYFDFVVQSYSSLGGHFSFNGTNLDDISTTFPFVILRNVSKTGAGSSLVIYFTAPANMYGENFAQIFLYVVDSSNASSTIVNVTVDALAGAAPTANPAGPITFSEETTSSRFSLNGTDTDSADADKLTVVITSLPTKATLYVVGTNGAPDQAIASVGVVLTNPTVYLVGSPLSYGSDSFTFAIRDAVNVTSDPFTVPIQIDHVNHPPVAGASITPGFMNSNLSFTVFGQDPDNDIPLTIFIASVPAVGTLYQNDGTVISSASPANPVRVTDFNGNLIYLPPTNAYGFPLGNISIFVDDNSGATNSNSSIFTTSLNVRQVDLPPTIFNLTLSMNQNTALNFTIVVTDIQSYTTFVTILTFPLYGNLYRANGSEITPSNPTLTDGFVTYVPPLKAFDNGAAPFATITYRGTAVSNTSLSSGIGIASISVRKTVGAPVFTGATQYNIPDNTNLTMLLTGSSETGSYGITILSSVASDRGILFTRTCMGDEMCNVKYANADTLPFIMDSPEMEYRLRYTPPTDKSGNAFANFTVIVTDAYGTSDPILITINIYHVNIPPVIVPWTYDTLGETYNWSNAIVNIVEGNDVVISWKLTDKDSLQENLTSLVYGLPHKGDLFYVATSTDGKYIAGQAITKSGSVVTMNSDGLFRLVYRPEPGKSGQNYATISLIGYDNIDQSLRISLKVNVKHINLGPVVQISQPNWNSSTGSPVIVTGVSINDTDASFYKETFVLSLTKADGSPAPTGSSIDLISYSEANCDRANNNATLNCTATLADLNQLLTQISLTVTGDGDYILTVFANDLGAGSTDRSALIHLNDTGYVYVSSISPASGGIENPNGNSVMTAVVAASAGAGAAAAFGVWRYMKKKSPPTADFFGSEGIDSTVTNNPLFEESDSMSFSNALYESSV